MDENTDTRLYDYREARKLLRIAQSTLEAFVRRGEIASVTVGRPGSRKPRRLFRHQDLVAFIESRRA
jgi:hypothetical protein